MQSSFMPNEEARAIVGGAFGIYNELPKPRAPRSVAHFNFDTRHNDWRFASYNETWTRDGLEQHVGAAMDAFAAATGVELPWNLRKGPWLSQAYEIGGRTAHHMRRPDLGADEWATQAFRFAGWLSAVADDPERFPAMVFAIQYTQSARGVNSPATKLCLWGFVRRHPSPHKVERLLWATMRRAEAINSAYSYNPRVKWSDVAVALANHSSVGKAAVIAVARTHLSGDIARYRPARQALIELRNGLRQGDLKDQLNLSGEWEGVRYRRQPHHCEEWDKGDMVFYKAHVRDGDKWRLGFLVVMGDLQFLKATDDLWLAGAHAGYYRMSIWGGMVSDR